MTNVKYNLYSQNKYIVMSMYHDSRFTIYRFWGNKDKTHDEKYYVFRKKISFSSEMQHTQKKTVVILYRNT